MTQEKYKIVVMGGVGNIGKAVIDLISHSTTLTPKPLGDVEVWSVDATTRIQERHLVLDVKQESEEVLVELFEKLEARFVINAMPFFLNSKIAGAAAKAGAGYLDFTEDDEQAARVYDIYKNYPQLTCAPKCGLAPGFINYLGMAVAKSFDSVDELNIRVGALPRNIRNVKDGKDGTYALSWSVDGLVNEYIRPCQVKRDGVITTIQPLKQSETLVLDGVTYEARTTSGGVGSLIHDLPQIPNINYKTIRYPGHYEFVQKILDSEWADFDTIKKRFLEEYPYTKDDVIVVYAEALGFRNHRNEIESFTARYLPGFLNLTGIQLTTACGLLAVLELIVQQNIRGPVYHKTISLVDFMDTAFYAMGYRTEK